MMRHGFALLLALVGALSVSAGCGSAGGGRSASVVESVSAAPNATFDDQVKDAVYALFDSPIDVGRAESFVCADSRVGSRTGADWSYKVARYEVESHSEESASVDVVLRSPDGSMTILPVRFAKTDGRWVICGQP